MKELIYFSLIRLITLYVNSMTMGWWVSTLQSGAPYFSLFDLVFINVWKIISYDHLKMTNKAFSWVSLTQNWILSAYKVLSSRSSVFRIRKNIVWPQTFPQTTHGRRSYRCDVTTLYSIQITKTRYIGADRVKRWHRWRWKVGLGWGLGRN